MNNAQYHNYKKTRTSFDNSKETTLFKDWKREQYNCQNGRCAWCYDKLDLHSPHTHVDHVIPLYKGGSNDFSNLVLACSDCNRKKGATAFDEESYAYGTGQLNFIDYLLDVQITKFAWQKPSWIKPNRYTLRDFSLPRVRIDEPNEYIPSRNLWVQNRRIIQKELDSRLANRDYTPIIKKIALVAGALLALWASYAITKEFADFYSKPKATPTSKPTIIRDNYGNIIYEQTPTCEERGGIYYNCHW